MAEGSDATVINDRYEVRRRVGRGGMADVFMAHDLLLNRDIAVKVLFPEFAVDPKFVERFRREAQSAASLSHPNIVNVYDWGKFEGTYFIAMEFVEGRTLADILKGGRRLNARQASEIASEVAAALGFAHEAGIAHRDIKPANILIGSNGVVKVADFGIARLMNGPAEANLTQAGSVMGTATYFSPEQAQGALPDPRSDLYSLGIVMYEMVAGQVPFTGENAVAIAYKQVHDEAIPLAELDEDLPMEFADIVSRLMRKDPEARYPDARALRDDLRRFRLEQPLSSVPSASPAPATARPVIDDDAATSTITPKADQPTDSTPTVVGPAIAGAPRTVIQQPERGGVERLPPGASPEARYFDDSPPRTGWYALAAFTALVLLSIGAFLVFQQVRDESASSPTRTLGDLTGQRLSNVTAALDELGLDYRPVPEPNDLVAEEFVHRTDPPPVTIVVEGTTIILYYNPTEALQAVPNVAGFTLDEARRQLMTRGFQVSDTTEVSDTAPGLVIRTEPAAGQMISQDTPLLIIVSGGLDQVSVPATIINDTEGIARETLESEAFGLRVAVQYLPDEVVPAGVVIRSDPAPNTLVTRGSEITLFVSAGPGRTTVPVLIGLSQQQAEDLLLERDLVWELRELEIQDPADPRIDVVFEQSLTAGDEVDKGASITFVIGRLVAPTTTDVSTSTSTSLPGATSSTTSTTTSSSTTSTTSPTTSTTTTTTVPTTVD
ncbi:MAG: Stk1 family PASTA domain-containing Ser/Thr kinase [Ilumatobacteraceae bacterium]